MLGIWYWSSGKRDRKTKIENNKYCKNNEKKIIIIMVPFVKLSYPENGDGTTTSSSVVPLKLKLKLIGYMEGLLFA